MMPSVDLIALDSDRTNQMLLYTTLGTNDLRRAVRFYEAIFAVLKQPRCPDWADGWAGWGKEYDEGFSFCLCPPFDEQPAVAGNDTMTAFRADSADQVRSF
jgi:catechol 2,3-dioxygenase-like lactoylglutathione lyase family enzyme